MALLIESLPHDVQKSHADLDAALALGRDLQRKGSEAAAAEPTYGLALEAARATLEEAELDFAFATDENEKTLRGTRDRKWREFQEAEHELERTRYLRNGIAGRSARAAAEILATKPSFDAVCMPFCCELLASYREVLRGMVYGNAVGEQLPLARALRLGYALLDALPFSGLLRSTLEGVSVPDFGPAPGRPVPRFIQGERCWPNDAEIAGTSLRDWRDDAEIATLHTLLKPLGAAYAEATARVRLIEEAQRRDIPAPAAAQEVRSEPPKVTGDEWRQSQPSLEEHRAEIARIREDEYARAGVTRPVEHTFAQPGRFAGARLA